MGRPVLSQEVLEPRARRGQRDARGQRQGVGMLERLEPRRVRLEELPGGHVGVGEGVEDRDPFLRRGGGGEQPPCAVEQAGGGGGVADGRELARLAEDGDGLGVALAAGVLDVVRPRRCRSAAVAERGGAALVRAQSPAAGRRLVDRAAHERVAKAEAAGHVRVADEVAAQQFVERLHRRPFGDPGGGTGELELERVAGDRRAVEHPPRACRQHRELLGEGGRHRARHLDTRERDLRPRGDLLRAAPVVRASCSR